MEYVCIRVWNEAHAYAYTHTRIRIDPGTSRTHKANLNRNTNLTQRSLLRAPVFAHSHGRRRTCTSGEIERNTASKLDPGAGQRHQLQHHVQISSVGIHLIREASCQRSLWQLCSPRADPCPSLARSSSSRSGGAASLTHPINIAENNSMLRPGPGWSGNRSSP